MPKSKPRKRPAKGLFAQLRARARAVTRSPPARHQVHGDHARGALRRHVRADGLLLREVLQHDRRAASRRARSRTAACLRAAARDSSQRRPLAKGSHRSTERSRLRAADAAAESRRVRRERPVRLGDPPRRQPHRKAADRSAFSDRHRRAARRARRHRRPSARASRRCPSTSSRSRASRSTRRC